MLGMEGVEVVKRSWYSFWFGATRTLRAISMLITSAVLQPRFDLATSMCTCIDVHHTPCQAAV